LRTLIAVVVMLGGGGVAFICYDSTRKGPYTTWYNERIMKIFEDNHLIGNQKA